MSIVIRYKKVWMPEKYKDGKAVEVVDVEALPYEKLPKEYVEGYPHCYYVDWRKEIVICEDDDKKYYLTMGKKYSWQEFKEMIELLEKCGDRLHKINKGLREIKEIWFDEEVHEVKI